MTQDRLRKARRLLDVQRQMQRLEEMKVAETRQRQAEAVAQQEEIVAALNGADALQGLFVAQTARRLKSLSEEERRLELEVTRRMGLLRAQAGRTKVAERQLGAREEHAAKAKAQKELVEIIERIVGPAAQASHKLDEGS